MLVKFPVAIVKDLRSSKDGSAQYVTIIEPGGGEYNFTARPNDPQFPLDAVARLRQVHETLDRCEIEAEVHGFMWSGDEGGRRQLLNLRRLTVKPVNGSSAPKS